MYQFADRFEGVEGSEIRKIFALLSDPEMISFAGGNPSPKLFPKKQLSEIAGELISSDGDRVLQYGGTKGIAPLIELLFEMNENIMRREDEIIILSGSSQGIELTARTLLNEGDNIIVEAPTFLGALQTFKLNRAHMHEVLLKDDGIDVEIFKEEINKKKPKFFYTIPNFQNPSGITTSEAKRKWIYELCAEKHIIILEDDPYGDLRYDGEPLDSYKKFDKHGIVIALRSFSKTISPGIRVGYAVADKKIIEKFNILKQGHDVHTSNLSQGMVYEYIKGGFLKKHIKEVCKIYAAQRDAMLYAIREYFPNDVQCTYPAGGLFLWVTLPDYMNSRELFERCVQNKVAFVVGSPFYAHGGHDNTLRLNFSMPDIEQINKGVEIIGRQIKNYKKD